jgi:parvulin-like peptidyl-prolyl isomerase
MIVRMSAFWRIQHALCAVSILTCLLATVTPVCAEDKAVASVNGDAITESEFYARLEHLRGQDFLLPTNPPTLRQETAGTITLNLLINQRIVLQTAAKHNVSPTDAEMAAEMANVMKQDAVKKALSEKSVSENDLKTDVRVQLARFKLATSAVTVSDTEVDDWYRKHIANYTVPEKWKLSVIRTSKFEDIPKIQAEIKNISFSAAAKEYSEDTRTKAQGGSMGIIFATDMGLPDSIRAAIKRANVGEVTPPIEIEFDDAGKKIKVWWLLKLEQRDAEVVHPLTEVKLQVQRLSLLEKAGGMKVADDKIEEFRKKADLKISLPGYEALANSSAPKPQ